MPRTSGEPAGAIVIELLDARVRVTFRVLAYWPRGRYLELAPRYWRITRARLDRDELDREVGWLTIPERAEADPRRGGHCAPRRSGE